MKAIEKNAKQDENLSTSLKNLEKENGKLQSGIFGTKKVAFLKETVTKQTSRGFIFYYAQT